METLCPPPSLTCFSFVPLIPTLVGWIKNGANQLNSYISFIIFIMEKSDRMEITMFSMPR